MLVASASCLYGGTVCFRNGEEEEDDDDDDDSDDGGGARGRRRIRRKKEQKGVGLSTSGDGHFSMGSGMCWSRSMDFLKFRFDDGLDALDHRAAC
jgi:hypothetical protein